MIGCACSQRVFFSTRNPGVVGRPNGMHLTQGDCVEELHYFAEPQTELFEEFYFTFCLHWSRPSFCCRYCVRPVTMEARVLSMAIGMSD
jgi:hypothetical protein